MYRTTKTIISLANGGARFRFGDYIGPEAVPEAAWKQLIAEGAVVEVSQLPSSPSVSPDATPRAAELAAELGVDLAAVEGSGTDGRILASDVRDAAERNESDDA